MGLRQQITLSQEALNPVVLGAAWRYIESAAISRCPDCLTRALYDLVHARVHNIPMTIHDKHATEFAT